MNLDLQTIMYRRYEAQIIHYMPASWPTCFEVIHPLLVNQGSSIPIQISLSGRRNEHCKFEALFLVQSLLDRFFSLSLSQQDMCISTFSDRHKQIHSRFMVFDAQLDVPHEGDCGGL